MPHSGSGTLVPLPSTGTIKTTGLPVISLADYARFIGYDECAFFGVNGPDIMDYQCRKIWNKWQRDAVSNAILQAIDMIEAQIGYLVTPRWTTEKQLFKCQLMTRWGYFIEPGSPVTDDIGLAIPVDYTSEPAVIGPIPAIGVTDSTELHVVQEGTEIEVLPTEIQLDTLTDSLTIYIPRCRLVCYDFWNNPENGWDYNILPPDPNSVFCETVDIKWTYTDETNQANLYYKKTCADPPCEDEIKTACIRIKDSEIGQIEVQSAEYVSGAWRRLCTTDSPYKMDLFYKSGLLEMNQNMFQTIIRLAHSLMPQEPCDCGSALAYWTRDHAIPQVLTAERLNCPFGLNDGAWMAWKFVENQKLVRAGIF